MIGPNLSELLPDPVLTNVATDTWKNGGWVADRLAPVKRVPKDKYRWATWDASVLDVTYEAVRSPGARANMVPRPAKTWSEGVIKESALRVEYSQEDIDNSISPDEPRVTGTQRIVNALQYLVEKAIHTKYLASGFAAGNKEAAAAHWHESTTYIQSDIEDAKMKFFKRTGIEANYLLMPRHIWPIFAASSEIKTLRVYTEPGLLAKGLPEGPIFGLQLIVPGARYDTLPTGTYTPAFVWTDNDVWIGYSPTLNGGTWDGVAPCAFGQFEATLLGESPFAVREYQSPYFAEDKTYIITADFRRTAETINAEYAYAITAVTA